MRIALITFHGAHNYGAVIQAYALQRFLIENKYECEIIDFRSKSQRDFNSLYPLRNGLKSLIKNALMLRYDNERRLRDNRFEHFINTKLVLTDTLITEEEQLEKYSDGFDCYIVGSDQVWNVTKKADTSYGYFLDFVQDKKNKIAYAVSLGNAQEKDLFPYARMINKFNSISTREKSAADIIRNVVNRDVYTVLDPTLLVDQKLIDRLTERIEPIIDGNYLFYYSLDGYDTRNRNVEELKALANRLNLKIVSITPEWPKTNSEIVNVLDAGPCEFLALLKNASFICTNSFHGTALSILFKKDFYVLDRFDGSDTRKIDILSLLELDDRMIQGKEKVCSMDIKRINYEQVNAKLNYMRKKSQDFLLKAIHQ